MSGAVLCVVGARRCAIPVEHVLETMRPLPAEPLAGLPPFVRGLAVIRGTPVPVVSASRLLGDEGDERATRYVLIRAGARRVALAVDEVIGVRDLSRLAVGELPPILGATAAGVAAAVGALDHELLVVLSGSHLIPDAAWPALEAGGAA